MKKLLCVVIALLITACQQAPSAEADARCAAGAPEEPGVICEDARLREMRERRNEERRQRERDRMIYNR